MTHVYHLDVDLLGGLHALLAEKGPHFIEIDLDKTRDDLGSNAVTEQLRSSLLQEAKAFLELEIDVASRKATALETDDSESEEGSQTAFSMDSARRAREDAAAHQRRLETLEQTVDEVLGVFRLVPADSETNKEDGIFVHLHWDGYAMEPDLDAKLNARREHLGLPSNADWHHHSSRNVA